MVGLAGFARFVGWIVFSSFVVCLVAAGFSGCGWWGGLLVGDLVVFVMWLWICLMA